MTQPHSLTNGGPRRTARLAGRRSLSRALGGLAGLVLLCTLSNAGAQETFTLNLKDTDIESLISTVSKRTGRNFVVDPRVKAKVTVISAKPMNAGELYEVFLSVLQVHGYAAVPSGELIKIVPDVNAKQGPVEDYAPRNAGSDEMVTHVIAVDNVPAAQLVPILRPLVPQQGHLAAYAATNVLVITDRAANVRRLSKIIDRIDRPDSDEIEIIRLEHASASEMVRIIGSLNAAGPKGATAADAPRLAADERTNSVLVSGDKSDRMRLRALIAHLDTPLEAGGNTRVVYLHYANSKDLVAILKGVNEGQQRAATQGKAKAATTKDDVDLQADEHTNALIITAPPDQMRNLLAVIRQLDIRRAQVLVEAIIAEISQDRSRELGVSFAAGAESGSPAGVANLGGSAGVVTGLANFPPSLPSGLTMAIGDFDSGSFDFGFLVRALASDANNNILSTPSLLTLDNQEAEIVVGQNVPFVTGQFTSTGTTTNSTNPFQTIERQDVGITLKVKPQINEGNTIKMDIEQEVSSLSGTSTTASDIVTNKRSIKTTVMVEDGQTVVLGGLIDDAVRDRDEKVPLLGDIPIIGRLFQYRSTTKVKQNLMVFLHPKIMRERTRSDYLTHEKYNYLRAQQMVADDQRLGLLPDETPVLPEIELLTEPGDSQAGDELDGNR